MTAVEKLLENVSQAKLRAVARAISILEDDLPGAIELASAIEAMRPRGVVIGITGAAGVGKSSLANKLVECIKARVQRVGVLAIDPSSPRTQGAFLGDRIRMIQHATDSRVLMRSMATRGMVGGVARAARAATQVMALAGCDPILLETTGVGQVETAIKQYADIVTVVLCPGAGDEVQTLKAGLFEIADLIVVNKSDKPGADELLAWLRSSLEGTRTALFAASASRGDGVWELAADLAARESQARGAGPLRIERTSLNQATVVDRVLSGLRPFVEDLVNGAMPSSDPDALARSIIDACSNRAYGGCLPCANHSLGQAPGFAPDADSSRRQSPAS